MLVVSEDLMMIEELPVMWRAMFSHEAIITDKKHSLADKTDHIKQSPGLKTLTPVAFYPSHMPFSKRRGKKQGKNFTGLSLSARPKGKETMAWRRDRVLTEASRTVWVIITDRNPTSVLIRRRQLEPSIVLTQSSRTNISNSITCSLVIHCIIIDMKDLRVFFGFDLRVFFGFGSRLV